MIELLLPYGFDTYEYSWVKETIGICTLAYYSVSRKCQLCVLVVDFYDIGIHSLLKGAGRGGMAGQVEEGSPLRHNSLSSAAATTIAVK
jgi:hypothetical protein